MSKQKRRPNHFLAAILGFILALIIVYSNFVYTIMAFLLVGAIPGTTVSISPTIMLLFFIGATLFFILHLSGKKIPPTALKRPLN